MNLKDEVKTELLNTDKDFQLSEENVMDMDKICSADSDLDAEFEKCQQILDPSNQVSNDSNHIIMTVPTHNIGLNSEINDSYYEKNIESNNFFPLGNTICGNPDKTAIKKVNKNFEMLTDLETEDDIKYTPCRKRIKLENVESVNKLEIMPTTNNLEIIGMSEKSKIIDNLNPYKTNNDNKLIDLIKFEDQKDSESCYLQNESIYEVLYSSDLECESTTIYKAEDTSYGEGDTLILCAEESDCDSELEKTLLDYSEEDFSDVQSLNENSDVDLILNASACNTTLENILNETDTSTLTIINHGDSELKDGSNNTQNDMTAEQNNLSHEGDGIDGEIENCNKILNNSNSELKNSKFNHTDFSVNAESFINSQSGSLENNLDFNLKKEIFKHDESKSAEVSSDISNAVKSKIVIEDRINTAIIKKEEPKIIDIKINIESKLLLSNDDFNSSANKKPDDCKVKVKTVDSETKTVPSNIDLNSEIKCTLKSAAVNIADDSKENVIVKDYLEDEKDDIANPEWQAVKNLNTNEERYQKVRQCWKSKTVPDPNKNLTYHSYRKKQFCNGSSDQRVIRQHKRHASSSLSGRNAKRLCTFFLDKEIDSVRRIKEQKTKEIFNEMNYQINNISQECFNYGNVAHDMPYHNVSRYDYLDRNGYNPINQRVSVVADEFNRMAEECEHSFEKEIDTLSERRNEVLKFYSFYKGLNDSADDPTLLTESQFQELDEIENIYKQFNYYYNNTPE